MTSDADSQPTSLDSFSSPVDSAVQAPFQPKGWAQTDWEARENRWRMRSLAIAVSLFLLTLVSTLAVGAQFAASYAAGVTPNLDDFFSTYGALLSHPQYLVAGLPYAFTLLGILLAHELGHFFACRYYGISASYLYFIPAPTLLGTFGAFIRIRSSISNRNALFDVGLAGPVVGFLFAAPALVIAILYSKAISANPAGMGLVFGKPLVLRLLLAILRPDVSIGSLLLNPVGQAAWAGLFATALNLLPGGQLDGGHILYAVATKYHRPVTLGVALLLIPLGYYFWSGWYLWSVLLAIGFRHPPLIYDREGLDRTRLVWAVVAMLIFILSFMPMPVRVN